jgi:uncharacterized protein (DUF488 family)
MSGRPVIWTIGHSDHPFERFLELLAGERIEFVVDVRSYPHSRHAPQFNREALARALESERIRYLFLGERLGGRPSRPEHYDAEGHALYGAMASEAGFRDAIDGLIRGADVHRIALVCSEGDPEHCHRRLLIGKVLTDHGVELRHIRRDGSVTVERDVAIGPCQQGALFGDSYERQWRSTRSVSHRRRLNASSAA